MADRMQLVSLLCMLYSPAAGGQVPTPRPSRRLRSRPAAATPPHHLCAGPPRGQLKAIDHNCNDIPDAAMTAAVVALLADGQVRLGAAIVRLPPARPLLLLLSVQQAGCKAACPCVPTSSTLVERGLCSLPPCCSTLIAHFQFQTMNGQPEPPRRRPPFAMCTAGA